MAINTLSNPNPLGNNGSRFYAYPNKPVFIDAQFTVAVADSAGLGITGLQGQGVNTVFMHTSTTAGRGPNGVVNPLSSSASVGYIWVQLANNYKNLNDVTVTLVSPTTGNSVAIDASDALLTVGQPYIINTIGTSTQADFQAIGLPLGLAPTVGQNFVAIATGAGTGSGTVKAVGKSSITIVEVVGTAPQQMLFPTPTAGISPNVGAWVMLQCLAATNSSTTTLIPTAPTDGSQVYLSLIVNQR